MYNTLYLISHIFSHLLNDIVIAILFINNYVILCDAILLRMLILC